MAKVKDFAVTVQIVSEVTLFVRARRPGGAEAAIKSDEGWVEATRYRDEDEGLPFRFDPKRMTVTKVRAI